MVDKGNRFVKFEKEVDQIAQLFKALPVEEQQTALKRFQDVLEQLQSACCSEQEKQPGTFVGGNDTPNETPSKCSSVEERLGKLEEQLDLLKRENANLKGTVLQRTSASGLVLPVKRGRGRPRKYPQLLPSQETSQKAIELTSANQSNAGISIERIVPIPEAPLTRQRSGINRAPISTQKEQPDAHESSDAGENDEDSDHEANDDFPNLAEPDDDSFDESDRDDQEEKKRDSSSPSKPAPKSSNETFTDSEGQKSDKPRFGPRGPQRKINRHVCRVCEKAFTHGRPFNRHLLKHDPGAVSCRKCHVEFYNEAVFLSHRCLDKDARVRIERVCRVCNVPFTSLKKLSQHLRKAHNMVSEPEYFCQYCKKGFVKKPSLYLHYREHAGDREVCLKCGTFVKHEEELQAHMAEHEAKDGFKCEKCKQTFKRRQQYESHMEGHKLYDCSICDQTFSQKKMLLAHCKSCHDIDVGEEGKQFSCSICKKAFLRPAALECHMKTHSDDQPARCETCDMVFKSATSLMKHNESEVHLKAMGQEMVQKDHLCYLCGKTFHKRAALARHMRYHSDHKPYNCPHCDYVCREQINMKRHISLHFSSRNFICEICGAAFHTKKTLGTHRIYKHSEDRSFPCPDCTMCFKTKSSLLRHGRSHMNQRLHKCGQCNMGFNRMYNLRRHMKSVHGNDQVLPPVKRVKLMDAPEGMEFHKGPAALGLLGKPPQGPRKKQNGETSEAPLATKQPESTYICTTSAPNVSHMMTIDNDQNGHNNAVLSTTLQSQVAMSNHQSMGNFSTQLGVQPQSYYGAMPQNYAAVEPIAHSSGSNQLITVQTVPDNTKWLLPSQTTYIGSHDHGRQDGTMNPQNYHQQHHIQAQIHPHHNQQQHHNPGISEQKLPDYTPAELYTAVPGLLHLMHGGPQCGPQQ